jgi:hypothetical protein
VIGNNAMAASMRTDFKRFLLLPRLADETCDGFGVACAQA